MGFSDDLRLLFLLVLNGSVLAAAAYAARRWTRDAIQRAIDAMLLWYAIQYAAICVPGVLHVLNPATMAVVALAAAGGLVAWARRRPPLEPDLPPALGRAYLLAATFLAAFLGKVIYMQNWAPMVDSDAITYHAPAAVQWLQTHRLGLFPTWFFNPANTFSPLGGSTLIAWTIAPLGGDTLARYVQTPAIYLAFLVALQLARTLKANPWAAAMLAIGAAVSRLCISEIINPRDDMFLAAMFGVAVAGCAANRLTERFGAARIGLALGLALATKYTALFSLPLLLVMLDAPIKAGWKRRQWLTVVGLTLLLAGPWYLRNLILTGNPVYPVEVQLFGHTLLRGLFVTERSVRLRTLHDTIGVFIGGYHGIPPQLIAPLAIGWLGSIAASVRRWREPLVRACVVGPAICLILFLLKAPYGEVRFLYPAMLVAMASIALIGGFPRWGQPALTLIAAVTFVVSLYTSYEHKGLLAEALVTCILLTVFAAALMCVDAMLGRPAEAAADPTPTNRRPAPAARKDAPPIPFGARFTQLLNRPGSPRPRAYFATAVAFLCAAFTYVYWMPYVGTVDYHTPEFWVQPEFYPDLAPGWRFLREPDIVPPDATLAYAQTYLVYPLYGSELRRHILYAPVRPDVTDALHLPHFPKPLAGEPINDTFTGLLNASADRAVWLQRLKAAGAQYLFVYLNGPDKNPWEDRFARDTPEFKQLFRDSNVVIYKINL